MSFTGRVRDQRAHIDVFVMEFLRGFMLNRLSSAASDEPPKKRARRGRSKVTTTATKNICHLPMLDCGEETGTFLKRLIAEFAGVPLGPHCKLLRNADKNMELFGY